MTRHRFDPFSFIAGGVTVAIALVVLLGEVSIRLVDLRIAGPVLVLALGLALLLGGSRDRPARDELEPARRPADPEEVQSTPGSSDPDDAERVGGSTVADEEEPARGSAVPGEVDR